MVPMCPADAVGCSDVAVVGPDVMWIVVIVIAVVVIAVGIFAAVRNRRG